MAALALPTQAQRGITYEQLANQQREQNIFFDNFTLPGSTPGTVTFVTTFRIDYNLLPFKKFDDPESDKNFFSPVGMNIEIFHNPNAGEERRKRRNDFSVEGLDPVSRTAWKDTAFAENYEQTKSKNMFITGSLTNELEPGSYSYILQFTRGEEVDGRRSRNRYAVIRPYNNKKTGQVILVEDVEEGAGGKAGAVKLLNFGKNVYYGRDFYTLVHLPNFEEGNEYRFEINRVDVSERDTTLQNTVHTGTIGSSELYRDTIPKLVEKNNAEYLQLNRAENGYTYALLQIPNSEFINAVYRLKVTTEGQDAPVAQSIFRSRWIEMPTSLLNVDIAIDMLRFIVDENTLREMKSGSNGQKEKKFRAFWEKRDPTPNTEFNELMAEYYRRIDYVYEQFSTINVNGYSTDRGKVYIQYGPPNNINRKFPPGEPAVEIWEYDNRQFVFRAISGFGEFKLVSD
ncbi:MAG: GWxTD domain-containing protein [Balneolaceae bacterium]|nr:GWxTD domain-containing protein [Balneolaceae bacterium]